MIETGVNTPSFKSPDPILKGEDISVIDFCQDKSYLNNQDETMIELRNMI